MIFQNLDHSGNSMLEEWKTDNYQRKVYHTTPWDDEIQSAYIWDGGTNVLVSGTEQTKHGLIHEDDDGDDDDDNNDEIWK